MEFHGFLPIDKPIGWTSHDVVARLRRIVGTRRVGHAGTLDPAATGVLVTGMGRATRFLDFVQAGTKDYVAHVVLGVTADTADIDGRIVPRLSREFAPSIDQIAEILERFHGEIDQVPPKYSAVKQGGEPLYKRMRRGEDVDVPIRKVRIDQLEIVSFRYPDLVLRIRCGSGVYIRSLAEDIGAALDCGAYLHHLLRTRVGRFTLDSCWSLDELKSANMPGSWSILATATDAGMSSLPSLLLERQQVRAWYHGRSVNAGTWRPVSDDPARTFTPDGTFAGLGTARQSGSETLQLHPRNVLAPN